MTRKREYATVLLVLAIAGGIAWWAFGRTWRIETIPSDGLTAAKDIEYTGRLLYPYASFIGIVALASVAGILATRKYGRIIIGVLLAILAGSAAVQLITDSGPTGWALIAEIALIVITIAGAATVVRGGSWPMFGSKYERTKPKEAESAWDVLDRGEDPTA